MMVLSMASYSDDGAIYLGLLSREQIDLKQATMPWEREVVQLNFQ